MGTMLGHARGNRRLWLAIVTLATLLALGLMALLSTVRAETFIIADGDVDGLIAAIEAANAPNADPVTIVLTANGVYELTAGYQGTSAGLPPIAGDVTIEGNGATIRRSSDGGTPNFRIFSVLLNARLHLDGVTVSGGITSQGGGIWSEGILALTNSTVENNTAFGSGGGVYQPNGQLSVTDSTIRGNTAELGGGIYAGFGAKLVNSTVSGNSATATGAGGGIFVGQFSSVSLLTSTVSGNTAGQSFEGASGGGIFNSGTLRMINSTVSGNDAVSGGGIQNWGFMKLTSSTVSGNTAASGGGIQTFPSFIAELGLTNSIVAGNTLTEESGSGPDIEGPVITHGGYNLIGDGSGMTGVVDGEDGTQVGTSEAPITPFLGELQNNGGPTETMALLEGSPALNVIPEDVNGCGDPEAGVPILFDQRGVERPQGTHCDVGAYEAEALVDEPDDPEPNQPVINGDCMKGGWEEYGFRNQGLCIQFVNTGKDSR